MELSHIIIILTIILMLIGKLPLYITATLGATLSLLAAGFSIIGTGDGTIAQILSNALNPVIVDMTGVLLFIGIMQYSHFMDAIILKVMQVGHKYGGAPGIATAAGLATALIGALSSFTQPVILATIAGPPAVKLGLTPNKTSVIISSANTVANTAGFTHPTMLAILAITGIEFGMINVWGLVGTITIYIFMYVRAQREMPEGSRELSDKGVDFDMGEDFQGDVVPFGKAIIPFIVLVVLFLIGMPIFLVGVLSSLVVVFMARIPIGEGEDAMVAGVKQIAIPLVATLSLMFLSGAITATDLIGLMQVYTEPILSYAPVQILFLISALAGLATQSFAASSAIVLPFVQLTLTMGASPLAVSFAGISGAAIMQLFLSGGALTALPVVAGVIPGTDQKEANKWQRPALLVGLATCFLLTFIV